MSASKNWSTSGSCSTICGAGSSRNGTRGTASTMHGAPQIPLVRRGQGSDPVRPRPVGLRLKSSGWGVGGEVQDRRREVHLAPPHSCPGSPLAPWIVVRHGPNITAVMKGCCQGGHLQRKLLVPPVHAQTTVTSPLRCAPPSWSPLRRHVDHWAQTSYHTKKGKHKLVEPVVVVERLHYSKRIIIVRSADLCEFFLR